MPPASGQEQEARSGKIVEPRVAPTRILLLLSLLASISLLSDRKLLVSNFSTVARGGAFGIGIGGDVARNASASLSANKLEDGCGAVDDRRSSTWTALPASLKEAAADVQGCLRRHGHGKMVTPVGELGLNCTVDVTAESVRLTLSRYGTVWLHGDSVMEQLFYTLACMMNSSVSLPTEPELGGPGKMRWKKGLGRDGIEKFAYDHPGGSTRFIYSRFGAQWGLDDNLYKHDFPLAVRTLTSEDAIFFNIAAHIFPAAGSSLERAMDFVAERSIQANASVFYLEPHPEEWPTSNGLYTEGCIFRCSCERLDDARLAGHGEFTQSHRSNGAKDKVYAARKGKPDAPFFRKLYPDNLMWENDTEGCVPNCLPATWRMDFVRAHLGRVRHQIHVVPIFWQLVSRMDGHSGRGHGDCTHKNMYSTMLMAFQWIRTIKSLD